MHGIYRVFRRTGSESGICQEHYKIPPRADIDNETEWGDDAEMKVFADGLEYTRPRGPYPKWTEVDNAIIEACQSVLTGSKTAEQAGKDAAAAIKAIDETLQ